MRRTATRRAEIRGQVIEPGDAVVMYYASANRDEEVFDRPNELEVRRQPNPHLAFGVGRHSCIGSALARLEARVFLQSFFETFTGIELAGDPVRLPSNVTNSWDHIPVRLSR
jgi:cytochrome P450